MRTYPDHQQEKDHTDFIQHSRTDLETSKAKYLGVTIDNTLSWNNHIDTDTKKANQNTAFLLYVKLSKGCQGQLQQVHSLSTTGIYFDGMGPCNKNKHSQSGVLQRRAARCCFNDYRRTSSVTSVLQELGWEDSKSRREQTKYQIVNNRVEIPEDVYHTAAGVSTGGHQQRVLVPDRSINAYKGSFCASKEQSACQCHISTNYGGLQDPHTCWYP